MADIAISQLPYGLPSNNAAIPFSQSGSTLKVAPSGLLVNAGKVGINTSDLRSELSFSRISQQANDSIELNVKSGISDGFYDGIKFSQGNSGDVHLAGIRCKYFNTGQTALEFSTRENTGTTLSASPMLILDRNNGNVLNHGLILSGSSYYSDSQTTNFFDSGITSLNVARGWLYGVAVPTTYVHILLPADFNQSNSQMFLLEIKGYNFKAGGAAEIMNMNIGGYVTPLSNGGPMRSVAVWSAAGSYSPTAYYSNTYNRGVARFYLSSAYYTSFVINSICVGNGRLIKPGELQIIYSTNSTI